MDQMLLPSLLLREREREKAGRSQKSSSSSLFFSSGDNNCEAQHMRQIEDQNSDEPKARVRGGPLSSVSLPFPIVSIWYIFPILHYYYFRGTQFQ
ncbi:hypothetical protein NC653_037042 [Populus alba x Populus x berolinensis]|uniref:Uncharacterized protein n=1 Tax=Populus alba x Populus x berolinensis TaxID=444605 RepID=A0AAD6LLC9_9ROSI|nr:hypothetical protein NC653_037042 [Populus alba x Populus x berolinensis]